MNSEPISENPTVPKPRRRWRRRLLLFLAVVVTTGPIVYWLVLPWVVRRQILTTLREQGLADARFEIAWISPRSARIANFSASGGDVRIGSVDISYRPLEVVRGKLDRIKINGVEIHIAIRNGKVERPPLAQSDSTQDAGPINLPFRSLKLSPAKVQVDWDGQVLDASLNASIDNTSAGGAVAEAAVNVKLAAGELILPGGANLRSAAGVSLVEGKVNARIGPPMSIQADVVLRGLGLTVAEANTELKDMNGAVTIQLNADGAVSTHGTQTITIGQAVLGKVDLKNASLAFRVEDSKSLIIDRLSAQWLGGSVSTKDVRIKTDDPKIQATLVADQLSLRDLLALTAEGRARGDGLISGPVTLRLSGSDVSFVGGQLRSQSPTGRVEVLDTQWLSETMDASDPRFTADAQAKLVKQRILGALADFSYDRLTFDFAEEPDARGRLSVSTHGKGTVGERPQELDFTLNFRGVNDVLKYGLRLSEWWSKLTNPEIGK